MPSFFMARHETTFAEYQEFLAAVQPDEDGTIVQQAASSTGAADADETSRLRVAPTGVELVGIP